MKYRIQIQQVFGGNWTNMEEAAQHAEWLQCDDIKPRSRAQGLDALEAKASKYKNGAPHRLVALHGDGTFEIHYTITRGTAFFPASVKSTVETITRVNATAEQDEMKTEASIIAAYKPTEIQVSQAWENVAASGLDYKSDAPEVLEMFESSIEALTNVAIFGDGCNA